jgi:hypothetical protein
MAIRIDLHVHTQRHSPCSTIDPEKLLRQAVRAGLDGLVITEHHYQWQDRDIQDLAGRAGFPGFLLLAGFEFASGQGDILVYGLAPGDVDRFLPGTPPGEAIAMAHERGGVCIAAHPTRAGMGFDEEILMLPLDVFETQSVNLKPHEQRMAAMLAVKAGKPGMAASDAHHLAQVGMYATDFCDPIRTMADLKEALRRGRFQPVSRATARTGTF